MYRYNAAEVAEASTALDDYLRRARLTDRCTNRMYSALLGRFLLMHYSKGEPLIF